MAKKVVSLRLDEGLLARADAEAGRQGVARTDLLESGLRAYLDDCEAGVYEVRERARRQVALEHAGPARGVGVCPSREGGLGHVWSMDSKSLGKVCEFCGLAGREFLAAATADRAALFARLRAPLSAHGKARKDAA